MAGVPIISRMKTNQKNELRSSRLYDPAKADDLASLALYAKAVSKTGQVSSAILRSLERKLLNEYYRTVSDPFKLIPELHDISSLADNRDDAEMIDAQLSLRLHSWTFEDFLHLPEYLPCLEVLRSGVEMTTAMVIDPDNDYMRGHSSSAVSVCRHFTPYRYATISEGCDPLDWLPVESEYVEDLVPFNVESFEVGLYAYTELHGITTEDARADQMRQLFSSLQCDGNAKEFELIPTSHIISFGGQDFFCRHPVTGEYGSGRHYYFADPIGRPMLVKDIKDFVKGWNTFADEDQQIGSAGSLRSKISRDGHYKNLFGEQVVHPKDKMILVNKSIEPRQFSKAALVDRQSCLRFQEYSTNKARFLDVSTPFLQKMAAEQFGFKTFEQLMSAYSFAWQLTTVSEYFDLDLQPWTPHPLHDYGTDEGLPHYYKMNNNYSDFII